MATQPLETIPEKTPAPTTTPARVTADSPKTKPATEKSPGRVASGKRLAERNRLAREAKKKAVAETATPVQASCAVEIDANIIAAKALWRFNCLAAETAWDIFKAPFERAINRELQQQLAAMQTENEDNSEPNES